MIIYLDIMRKMQEAGWTSYRIKKEKRLPGSVVDRLRTGRPVTTDTIDTVCEMCNCQPGDLLKWIPDAADTPEKE